MSKGAPAATISDVWSLRANWSNVREDRYPKIFHQKVLWQDLMSPDQIEDIEVVTRIDNHDYNPLDLTLCVRSRSKLFGNRSPCNICNSEFGQQCDAQWVAFKFEVGRDLLAVGTVYSAHILSFELCPFTMGIPAVLEDSQCLISTRCTS